MPRKHFRKFLPSQAAIQRNRYLAPFGAALHHHNLWHLNRRSVAGGVAVGLFCGLIPGPLQMLTAALAAIVLRVNLPVAAVATWYTNPLTILPLYYLAYRLGMWVTGHQASEATPAAKIDLGPSNISQWIPQLIQWIAAMGEPFLWGLLLLAAMLAVCGYFAVLGTWRLYVTLSWRRRQRARPSVPSER